MQLQYSFKVRMTKQFFIDGTIWTDAEQSAGRHYDLHSMYGWSETEPTLR
jgi:hypothetical protein